MPLRSHFSILPHATERYAPSPAIALDTDGNDGSHTIMQPSETPPLEVPVPPAGSVDKNEPTDEVSAAILAAETIKRLEDLYMPYKPKKRTLATTARERGLEPFALALWNRDPAVANLAEVLPGMVNPEKQLATTDDVLLGAQH